MFQSLSTLLIMVSLLSNVIPNMFPKDDSCAEVNLNINVLDGNSAFINSFSSCDTPLVGGVGVGTTGGTVGTSGLY